MDEHDALMKTHTRQDLENARTKGQMIGLIQGAGAVVALGLVLKLVGWIPVLAVGAAVAYLGYRLLFRKRQ
ncbi:MAG: hypothetical protein R2909_15255 [Gemmatimonadales bacterium]